jgi:transposase-like protein
MMDRRRFSRESKVEAVRLVREGAAALPPEWGESGANQTPDLSGKAQASGRAAPTAAMRSLVRS